MAAAWGTLSLVAAVVAGVGVAAPGAARATKLVEVRTADDQYLMVHFWDGEIAYQDDGKGPTAFQGHESQGGEKVITYGKPLDTKAATRPASFTITSPDDPGYAKGIRPAAVYRKTKVNGTTSRWPEPEHTVEHTLFLKLPRKLAQGKRYTLRIAPATNSDAAARAFTFDIYRSVSEAVHVNRIGYNPDHTAVKSADLYLWLGDGGARDYSAYAGKRVLLFNVRTGQKHPVGTVKFWKPSGTDYGGWNLTRSPVWNCDFSAFRGPEGIYRLVVEGVGCSPDFALRQDVYFEPYRTSLRGFFYMRIGAEKTSATPAPRQPRFVPGVDPPGFTVYRTTLSPWHPDWKSLGGDPWDHKDWSKYREPGNPTNPNAWGGHSDALDWDRNPPHVSIIWDLLLPYLLSNGKLAEDNLGIPESGNGIPDLIDEARYEVDFWLRLRDGKGGYGSGLNNPDETHRVMYQGAARPWMAWANAANCAMLADAFRVAGKPDLAAKYRDAAREAWKVANDEDLDLAYGIGDAAARGRDLKMMAAAFLYNVTGERAYEDVVAKESVAAASPTAEIDRKEKHCQLWGTAAYLMCAKRGWRPIHYPKVVANMRASLLKEAREKHLANAAQWPSRRASDRDYGWFQTRQEVQRLCIAHAVATDDPAQKSALLRGMLLEADYGLGRNPMNMVQMTGLGSRHAEDIYTSGRNDGVPGVHPGHTPYMNAEPWGQGFMFDPKWYAARGYPAWEKWPHGEALWRARYCFANNEFTPQQTMRGKMCLLAYLYSLGQPRKR